MSLLIGPVRLDNPVILAPMSGVSDMPFRRLVKRHGAGLGVSEMIASQAMIRANEKTLKMSTNCEDEHPIAVQLAGCEPEAMAEAARMNEDRGAAIIDINMGCPVKKVTKGDAGAALMKDEALAGRIVEAVVKAVKLPVTVKMRLGWDDSNRNAVSLAQIAEDCGAVALTVHGRTRSQFYRGHADWRAIGAVKQAVGVPVIGNGDVTSYEKAHQLLDQSGVDGVMIGRGCYGRPWFPGLVAKFLETGQEPEEPKLEDQYAVVVEHYKMMLEHYGERGGVRIARKHLGWYSKGLPGSAEFRSEINTLDNPAQVLSLIDSFYLPLCEKDAA